MNPESILEGVAILVLGSMISYAATRLFSRRNEAGDDVKRRRRRESLGQASRGHGTSLDIEDISVTGALLRTKGPCQLRHNETLDLNLAFTNGSTASVRAIVVRTQRPRWRSGLVGGAGVSFHFNGEEDPNKLEIENFIAADSH
jgi:hypothetical protein